MTSNRVPYLSKYLALWKKKTKQKTCCVFTTKVSRGLFPKVNSGSVYGFAVFQSIITPTILFSTLHNLMKNGMRLFWHARVVSSTHKEHAHMKQAELPLTHAQRRDYNCPARWDQTFTTMIHAQALQSKIRTRNATRRNWTNNFERGNRHYYEVAGSAATAQKPKHKAMVQHNPLPFFPRSKKKEI